MEKRTEMNFNLDLMLPYEQEVRDAISKCITDKHFILGPEVEKFETNFAQFTNQAHCIGVGNGTDALRIALLALGIGPGDEVISPAFNVGYTALAVTAVGATNVFVDCDPNTMLLDISLIAAAITPRTRCIIPVHLFGQMLDMHALAIIARENRLMIIEDAAQCHGATYAGEAPGKYSHAVAYSHYPTKNLGALGEAGSITTNISSVAERCRLLRDGGRTDRYLHSLHGINSCLDELQATVLNVKLKYLQQRNKNRREIAAIYYGELLPLGDHLSLPFVAGYAEHVFHLFVLRANRRDELRTFLCGAGIPTLIHYPVPVPYQPCFMDPLFLGPWPEAEDACREVLSLPMHPDLKEEEQFLIINAIKGFYGKT